MSKKESLKWGVGGVVGGGTKYDQINLNNNFNIHQQNGLNQHKANIKTDKPYDSHINKKN